MIVKLLTEHHLEYLSLKGCCRGSSESTHCKMPHCWKSHQWLNDGTNDAYMIIASPIRNGYLSNKPPLNAHVHTSTKANYLVFLV